MEKQSKIYIAGHTGLLGTAMEQYLRQLGYDNLLTPNHADLDLTQLGQVNDFFQSEQPEYVFMMAGLVGGIKANSERMSEFALENIQMATNVISACHTYAVKKLLYLGSSCIYPCHCQQPIKEEYLLTGALEPTNEGFALAKIMGIRLCQYYKQQYGDPFISCIPANIYGPNDNFDEENNHVVPALIKRLHRAKENGIKRVDIWGSGKPQREFLFIDDAIEACYFLMTHYEDNEPVNIGVGKTTSIRELAELIAETVGYQGELYFDRTKPDGMMERKLDSSKMESLGWKAETELRTGIQQTYEWYLQHGRK